MAKRVIDPHLVPHPVLPGRAVSGRILPTTAALAGPALGSAPRPGGILPGPGPMGGGVSSRLLPSVPAMVIAAAKPKPAARGASKPKAAPVKPAAKGKAAAVKAKSVCRSRGMK